MINSRIENIATNEPDVFTDEVVKRMWHLVNNDAKPKLVENLAKNLKKDNDDDTLRSVYKWVSDNIPYRDDPANREQLTALSHQIYKNKGFTIWKYWAKGLHYGGDCDDMVIALCGLLERLGFRTSMTVIAWRKPQFTHVICEVWHNGKWFPLDPTRENGFGNTVPKEKIRRIKRNENPMEIEMINDNTADYGRSITAPLSDCGCKSKPSKPCKCGGKCGGCKEKASADNSGNINVINIGNEESTANSGNSRVEIGKELQKYRKKDGNNAIRKARNTEIIEDIDSPIQLIKKINRVEPNLNRKNYTLIPNENSVWN